MGNFQNFITTSWKDLELIQRRFWAWLCLTNAATLCKGNVRLHDLGQYFYQKAMIPTIQYYGIV